MPHLLDNRVAGSHFYTLTNRTHKTIFDSLGIPRRRSASIGTA